MEILQKYLFVLLHFHDIRGWTQLRVECLTCFSLLLRSSALLLWLSLVSFREVSWLSNVNTFWKEGCWQRRVVWIFEEAPVSFALPAQICSWGWPAAPESHCLCLFQCSVVLLFLFSTLLSATQSSSPEVLSPAPSVSLYATTHQERLFDVLQSWWAVSLSFMTYLHRGCRRLYFIQFQLQLHPHFVGFCQVFIKTLHFLFKDTKLVKTKSLYEYKHTNTITNLSDSPPPAFSSPVPEPTPASLPQFHTWFWFATDTNFCISLWEL